GGMRLAPAVTPWGFDRKPRDHRESAMSKMGTKAVAAEQQRAAEPQRAAERQRQPPPPHAPDQARPPASGQTSPPPPGRAAAGEAPSPGQPEAAEAPPRIAADRPFDDVDRDSDGFVGRRELAMIEGLEFAELDTDQDGRIAREEWESSAYRQ